MGDIFSLKLERQHAGESGYTRQSKSFLGEPKIELIVYIRYFILYRLFNVLGEPP